MPPEDYTPTRPHTIAENRATTNAERDAIEFLNLVLPHADKLNSQAQERISALVVWLAIRRMSKLTA